MGEHVQAMLELKAAGAVVFDYGNNIRAEALKAGRRRTPSTSRASCPPTSGRSSARARARSAGPRSRAIPRTSRVTDDAVLEHLPRRQGRSRRWITLARERVQLQGLPARICWLGYGERAKMGLVFNELVRTGAVKAPIVIGRDHLDAGSVASPNRETEAMQDGSDAVADWPILNALLNAVSGATWVSVHHGGGVGMGYSIHAGMVVVADGTPEAARAARARAHHRPRHGRHAPRRRGLRARARGGARARRADPAASTGERLPRGPAPGPRGPAPRPRRSRSARSCSRARPAPARRPCCSASRRALEREGWRPIYLDLMGAASSPDRFVLAALDALPAERFGDRLPRGHRDPPARRLGPPPARAGRAAPCSRSGLPSTAPPDGRWPCSSTRPPRSARSPTSRACARSIGSFGAALAGAAARHAPRHLVPDARPQVFRPRRSLTVPPLTVAELESALRRVRPALRRGARPRELRLAALRSRASGASPRAARPLAAAWAEEMARAAASSWPAATPTRRCCCAAAATASRRPCSHAVAARRA